MLPAKVEASGVASMQTRRSCVCAYCSTKSSRPTTANSTSGGARTQGSTATSVAFSGQVNGVAGAAHPGGLYLNLGRRSGGSQVRIELCDDEPTDSKEWEDVVEVSVHVSEPGAGWMTWAGEDGGPLEIAPGPYRVRVSARGRDEGDADELAEEVLDFYLVQFWASPPRPDEIIRTTSKNAAYGHRTVGGRR